MANVICIFRCRIYKIIGNMYTLHVYTLRYVDVDVYKIIGLYVYNVICIIYNMFM